MKDRHKGQRLNLWVDPNLYKAVGAMAKQLDINMSEYIRRLVIRDVACKEVLNEAQTTPSA
jgi:hypothetical protein